MLQLSVHFTKLNFYSKEKSFVTAHCQEKLPALKPACNFAFLLLVLYFTILSFVQEPTHALIDLSYYFPQSLNLMLLIITT